MERGYIDAGYVASMVERETQANTFLGSGVAIPHGLSKDRALIRQVMVVEVRRAPRAI